MSDKKTPQEASLLFHNIIKASVSPKATGAVEKKEKKEVTPLEFWANYTWEYIKKNKTTKPNALLVIYEMEDFKNSGVSQIELENALSDLFKQDRQKIKEAMIKKLNNL